MRVPSDRAAARLHICSPWTNCFNAWLKRSDTWTVCSGQSHHLLRRVVQTLQRMDRLFRGMAEPFRRMAQPLRRMAHLFQPMDHLLQFFIIQTRATPPISPRSRVLIGPWPRQG